MEAVMMEHKGEPMAEVSEHDWARRAFLSFNANVKHTLTIDVTPGPVTDYTSSMVQWMRHRQPRYKGGPRLEMERPSPSYIVDVRGSSRLETCPLRRCSNML